MAQQILKQELSISQILRKGKQFTRIREKYRDVPDINAITQRLITQEMTISQILRSYGKQFTQIKEQYTDGLNGRCAMGVIMSYYGWDGKCFTNSERRLYAALVALRQAGIGKELLIELNDSGATFDEIADYLDENHALTIRKN
jgi:hypothetical protein